MPARSARSGQGISVDGQNICLPLPPHHHGHWPPSVVPQTRCCVSLPSRIPSGSTSIDDFQSVPFIAYLKPSGKYVMEDVCGIPGCAPVWAVPPRGDYIPFSRFGSSALPHLFPVSLSLLPLFTLIRFADPISFRIRKNSWSGYSNILLYRPTPCCHGTWIPLVMQYLESDLI